MALRSRAQRYKWMERLPIAAPGWHSGCPVCGHHDEVRQLDTVYQDRELRFADMPPVVTRFGLMARGNPLLGNVPRPVLRFRPPRRPSALATLIGMSGPQVASLVGIPCAIALLVRLDTSAEVIMSMIVAGLLGACSGPLYERAQKAWQVRTEEWEQAMRTWRGLRYCRRCDQVFTVRG